MNTSNAACAAAAFRERQPYWGNYVKHLHKQTKRQLDTSAWKNSWCLSASVRVSSKKKIKLLALANSYSELRNIICRRFWIFWNNVKIWEHKWHFQTKILFWVVWSAVFSGAHWLEDHISIEMKKKPQTIVWGKEGHCAKILDSSSTKQILFVSAALEVILLLAFSNAVISSMPLQFWRNVTAKQGLCFSFQKSTQVISNTIWVEIYWHMVQ